MIEGKRPGEPSNMFIGQIKRYVRVERYSYIPMSLYLTQTNGKLCLRMEKGIWFAATG